MKRTLSIIAAVLVVGLVVAYVARNPERKSLDNAARSTTTGRFVRLPDGVTQYDVAGPNGARTVVLLAGATVPYYIWDSTATALAANGFRVVRYNYYGRGFSDRPRLRYDLAMYDRQLTSLLDTLGVRGPVDVGGVSMGAVIAANFADRHPERVRSVILVDPAFATQRGTPFPLGVPGVGEYLMTTVAEPGMAQGQLTDFVHPERYPDWVPKYEVQMQYRGFVRSMLRTIRGDVFVRPASSFTTLARGQTPILLLWGTEDRTVAFAQSDSVRAAFPRAEFQAIAGAAHLPHIEQAAVVDSILLHFLR